MCVYIYIYTQAHTLLYMMCYVCESAQRLILITRSEKLRDLLKCHGDFGKMELAVKKFQRKMFEKSRKGQWVTRAFPMANCHWTKCFDPKP